MVFYHKYVLNIVKGITTGQPIACVYEVDQEIELDTAKRWCFIGTMVFLIVSLNTLSDIVAIDSKNVHEFEQEELQFLPGNDKFDRVQLGLPRPRESHPDDADPNDAGHPP